MHRGAPGHGSRGRGGNLGSSIPGEQALVVGGGDTCLFHEDRSSSGQSTDLTPRTQEAKPGGWWGEGGAFPPAPAQGPGRPRSRTACGRAEKGPSRRPLQLKEGGGTLFVCFYAPGPEPGPAQLSWCPNRGPRPKFPAQPEGRSSSPRSRHRRSPYARFLPPCCRTGRLHRFQCTRTKAGRQAVGPTAPSARQGQRARSSGAFHPAPA